jgi:diamine N-acetyltransferase
MTVTLRPISKENWQPVYWLSDTLTADQQRYVAPNGFSMLEAVYDAENLTTRAIYADETPVGFLMTGYDETTDRHWVVRLMIGGAYQGKGYGREAMKLAIDQFKSLPKCVAVYIGFHPENQVARQLYASLGFIDTGKIEYEEVVYRLSLVENPVS